MCGCGARNKNQKVVNPTDRQKVNIDKDGKIIVSNVTRTEFLTRGKLR